MRPCFAVKYKKIPLGRLAIPDGSWSNSEFYSQISTAKEWGVRPWELDTYFDMLADEEKAFWFHVVNEYELTTSRATAFDSHIRSKPPKGTDE